MKNPTIPEVTNNSRMSPENTQSSKISLAATTETPLRRFQAEQPAAYTEITNLLEEVRAYFGESLPCKLNDTHIIWPHPRFTVTYDDDCLVTLQAFVNKAFSESRAEWHPRFIEAIEKFVEQTGNKDLEINFSNEHRYLEISVIDRKHSEILFPYTQTGFRNLLVYLDNHTTPPETPAPLAELTKDPKLSRELEQLSLNLRALGLRLDCEPFACHLIHPYPSSSVFGIGYPKFGNLDTLTSLAAKLARPFRETWEPIFRESLRNFTNRPENFQANFGPFSHF